MKTVVRVPAACALAAPLAIAAQPIRENPGVLLDVTSDDNGDLDRESFLVKVVNGKQVVTRNAAACCEIARQHRRAVGRP